jgi:hypothetical protein
LAYVGYGERTADREVGMETRVFINGTPLEEVPEAEREKFWKDAAEKLGEILDEWGAAYEKSNVQRL